MSAAVMHLSLDEARTIVSTALGRARESDLPPLAAVVLDAGGHIKALEREDGCGIMVADIASGKAWSALGIGVPSRQLADKSAPLLAALSDVSRGRLVPAPGGVLICRDSYVIGSAGVSGASAEDDEACAEAGIEAAGLSADADASSAPRRLYC